MNIWHVVGFYWRYIYLIDYSLVYFISCFSIRFHQPHGCLLNRLFRRKSKKTSKLRVTGLCAGNSPGTGEFPAQMASYAENVSIWWRHHGLLRIGHVRLQEVCCVHHLSVLCIDHYTWFIRNDEINMSDTESCLKYYTQCYQNDVKI